MKLYNEDCLDRLKQLPDESIDLVVTDCPYHIVSGGCTTGAYGNNPVKKTNSVEYARKGKIFQFNDLEFSDWLPDIYRVMKKQTHCYIMINPRNLAKLQMSAEEVGFKFQQLIVWDKVSVNTPNRYYLNGYELILMLSKRPARNINNMGTKNILRLKPKIGNRLHPTEKPVELMKILVANSSSIGEVVLDPFMGAGTTGIACRELGREFIGIEIDQKYFEIAKKRIKF